jgi:hypothetical protein
MEDWPGGETKEKQKLCRKRGSRDTGTWMKDVCRA